MLGEEAKSDDLSIKTTQELRDLCRNKQLKTTGTKNALLGRLQKYASGDRSGVKQESKPKEKRSHGEKYCCIPGCHSVSGKVCEDGTVISLHRIPSGVNREELRKRWLSAITNVRKDVGTLENPDTRICNLHFEGHVVKSDSIPDHFPTARKPRKDVKPRRLLTRKIPKPTCTVTDPADFVSQTESESASELEPEPEPKAASISVQTETITTASEAEVQVGCGDVKMMSDAETQTDPMPDITPEDLEKDDKKTRFYTGFVNFSMFMLMYTALVKQGAEKLNYWDGPSRSMGEKPYQAEDKGKPGRKRKLTPKMEFLMTMMRLRLGLMQEHLADIFKVGQSTVSRTLNTWINFLFDACQDLVAWPTVEQIRFNIPRAFQDFPNVQVVIDCTEFFIEKPSSLLAQWLTWSEYKHHNTFKILIGVAPNGMVTFVSRLWGGRASDRHITQEDGFLPRLHPDMPVMGDKGFTIEDLLPPNIDLNAPPRIPTARPMTEEEFFITCYIASARIVVEMKMEEIKNFRCLQGVLPLSEAHLAEQMVFVCAALTNFNPPLLK